MIVYDNSQQVRILLRVSGSIVPRCLPVGLFTLLWGAGLAVSRHLELTEDIIGRSPDFIDDDAACRIFGVVVGWFLVVRVNVALSRWMDGISQVQTMLCKWTDAFNCLNGFLCGREVDAAAAQHILFFRIRVAHYFALMSCLAFSTLRTGHTELLLDEVPIKAKFPLGAGKSTFATCRTTRLGKGATARLQTTISGAALDVAADDKAAMSNMRDLDLAVLHAPTEAEVAVLAQASDKVKTICLWIAQAVMVEVSNGVLDCPPPIVSRIFAEISDGMLGFHQALRVSHVPFPFPFAQIVSLLLMALYLILPMYIDVFTQNVVLTPVIAFVLPMCYCGINQIAVELEEPFGLDKNDVDIEERHEAFIQWMMDVLTLPMEPPMQPDNVLERSVIRGYEERAVRPRAPGEKPDFVPWFVDNPNQGVCGDQKAKAIKSKAEGGGGGSLLGVVGGLLGLSLCCNPEAVGHSISRNEEVVTTISSAEGRPRPMH